MGFVSARKGHWLSQLCIISPIFKSKWLKKMALCFLEFPCVWQNPGREMGEAKMATGFLGSWNLWVTQSLPPNDLSGVRLGCISPPEYVTGILSRWTWSPCSLNKVQQSTGHLPRGEEANLMWEMVGGYRQNHNSQGQGRTDGWDGGCGWGCRGRRGVGVHVCNFW